MSNYFQSMPSDIIKLLCNYIVPNATLELEIKTYEAPPGGIFMRAVLLTFHIRIGKTGSETHAMAFRDPSLHQLKHTYRDFMRNVQNSVEGQIYPHRTGYSEHSWHYRGQCISVRSPYTSYERTFGPELSGELRDKILKTENLVSNCQENIQNNEFCVKFSL